MSVGAPATPVATPAIVRGQRLWCKARQDFNRLIHVLVHMCRDHTGRLGERLARLGDLGQIIRRDAHRSMCVGRHDHLYAQVRILPVEGYILFGRILVYRNCFEKVLGSWPALDLYLRHLDRQRSLRLHFAQPHFDGGTLRDVATAIGGEEIGAMRQLVGHIGAAQGRVGHGRMVDPQRAPALGAKTVRDALNSLGVPEDKLEKLALLNGVELGDQLADGSRLKLV